MAFQSNRSSARHGPAADINLIPLIDVMLVLVIVLMVTASLIHHSVPLNLPKLSATPQVDRPDVLVLSIDQQGQFFLNQKPVAMDQLMNALQPIAAAQPQPNVRLHADQAVPYQHVAQALVTLNKVGLTKVSFVTDPSAK